MPKRIQEEELDAVIEAIPAVVAEVVRGCLGRTAAVRLIRRYATENVPEDARDRFAEVVETELMALHEGNIARYRLRPSDYHTWHNAWRS
jgi:hypothetical protein